MALLVHFGDLRYPRGAIWDESYYLTSTQRYLEGRAQYASHPPLGLMLIAGGAWLTSGTQPPGAHALAALKKVSGAQIPGGYNFFGVRFASALCGALAGFSFFCMLLWWSGRPRLSALFSLPILFDNALAVQARAAQIDGPQLLFTVLALWAFLAALRRVPGAHLVFGLCVGLATMVRLNGILLSLFGLAILWADIRAIGWRAALLRGVPAMLGPFLATVLLVLLAHVLLSPHLPALDEAGVRDLAFMSPRYQAWLRDGGVLAPAVLWDAALGYWRYMLADLDGMTRVDPNGASPLLWPLGQKTITYRWIAGEGHARYVQMVPNLVGWWMAAAAILAALLGRWRVPAAATAPDSLPTRPALIALTLWYGVFLGANLVLAQQRVMYIYHYFMGLVVAYLVLALLGHAWLTASARADRMRVAVAAGIALVANFWFFFPLTYNVELPTPLCHAYNLVLPIVDCIGER